MLTDSLPTNATSSCEMNPARLPEALVPVTPDRPARSRYHERALRGINTPRDENTWQAVSARERHGKPQLVGALAEPHPLLVYGRMVLQHDVRTGGAQCFAEFVGGLIDDGVIGDRINHAVEPVSGGVLQRERQR